VGILAHPKNIRAPAQKMGGVKPPPKKFYMGVVKKNPAAQRNPQGIGKKRGPPQNPPM